MMLFLKSDMIYSHYNWSQDESPPGRPSAWEPSRKTFDPQNGDQVLSLINYHFACTGAGTFTLMQAKAMEKQIAMELPLELKSELSVSRWLLQLAAAE